MIARAFEHSPCWNTAMGYANCCIRLLVPDRWMWELLSVILKRREGRKEWWKLRPEREGSLLWKGKTEYLTSPAQPYLISTLKEKQDAHCVQLEELFKLCSMSMVFCFAILLPHTISIPAWEKSVSSAQSYHNLDLYRSLNSHHQNASSQCMCQCTVTYTHNSSRPTVVTFFKLIYWQECRDIFKHIQEEKEHYNEVENPAQHWHPSTLLSVQLH